MDTITDEVKKVKKAKIDLDPLEASQKKEIRRYRLNVIQIPLLRLIGFSIIALLVFIHNTSILGTFIWPRFLLFTIILFSYALLSWLILFLFFNRLKSINLGFFFLTADTLIFSLAIYFSGGENSLLFFLLVFRIADQTYTNFKRVLFFSHLSVFGYLILTLYLYFIEHRPLLWPVELFKALFIYSGNLYISLTAKTAEDLRNRISASIRVAKDELRKRIKTEEALRQSKARFKDVAYSMADWIWEVDKAGSYTYTSKRIKHILGYDADEIIGKEAFDLMPENEAKRVKEVFRDIVTEKKPIVDLENWNLTKDGKKVCLLTNGVPLLDDTGELIGYRGVDKDITDRKRAEEENKILETELQRAEKMKLVGTLAGGVAHDLNNILGGLVSYPELLLIDLPEDSPLRNPILKIKKSGEKAAAIVQDLLTLARRGVNTMDVINLNDIIIDYLKSPEYEKLKEFHPNVKFETSLETNLLNIFGSAVHLSKTVMNLSSNAAEALPDGGKVSISTKNKYIDGPIKGYNDIMEGDYVVLSVTDDGVGISTKDLERIFEPFYTKKVMGRSGTGLGMAVVWGTVKDHKGYIGVQSTEGEGATFDLYFPVTRKEAEKDKSQASVEKYMGKGERILVVDDVQEQREIASMLLSKLGYSVHTVPSGEDAVKYMKTSSADLLILDMIMSPGIDGLDTYKNILKLHPAQKAILASGFSETDRVKEAKKLGAGRYLKKPYSLEQLGVTVKAELDSA